MLASPSLGVLASAAKPVLPGLRDVMLRILCAALGAILLIVVMWIGTLPIQLERLAEEIGLSVATLGFCAAFAAPLCPCFFYAALRGWRR